LQFQGFQIHGSLYGSFRDRDRPIKVVTVLKVRQTGIAPLPIVSHLLIIADNLYFVKSG
jgi:hypothetical protein